MLQRRLGGAAFLGGGSAAPRASDSATYTIELDRFGSFDVRSFSWETETPSAVGPGAAGHGKARFRGLNWTTQGDGRTAQLRVEADRGGHIKWAELVADKPPNPPFVARFEDVSVESVRAAGDDYVQITLTFAELKHGRGESS